MKKKSGSTSNVAVGKLVAMRIEFVNFSLKNVGIKFYNNIGYFFTQYYYKYIIRVSFIHAYSSNITVI